MMTRLFILEALPVLTAKKTGVTDRNIFCVCITRTFKIFVLYELAKTTQFFNANSPVRSCVYFKLVLTIYVADNCRLCDVKINVFTFHATSFEY